MSPNRVMIVFCLFILHLWSQGASGSLTGLVRDSSGSSVPQAKLVLTNTATQEKLSAGVTEVFRLSLKWKPSVSR